MFQVNRRTLTVLLLSNFVLALAFLICLVCLLTGGGREKETADGMQVDTDALVRLAGEYRVNTDYLQAILPDYLVYEHAGQYVFEPIDTTLAKADYDHAAFRWENGRLTYEDADYPNVETGIDVSEHQGEINWQQVAAADIDYAIIRVGYRGYTEGALYEDTNAMENLAGASAAGLKLGAYFFSQAISVEEAVEEADLAIETLKDFDVEMPVVFDMEEIHGQTARTDVLSRDEVTAIAAAFCKRLADAGYTPVVYGNAGWLAGRMDLHKLEDYDLWLARYSDTPEFPYQFTMWQYTDAGTVPGISGNVDMNLCFTPYGAE